MIKGRKKRIRENLYCDIMLHFVAQDGDYGSRTWENGNSLFNITNFREARHTQFFFLIFLMQASDV
jgi:hypothetical protein